MTNYYNVNNKNKPDLLVIGSGIAGCTAALQAADMNKHVMIITSSRDPLKTASYLAQGGIIYKAFNEPNEPELFSEDIRRAGAYRSDEYAIEKITQEGPAVVDKFLLGGRENHPAVPFDRVSSTGELSLCLEASHNRPRILHWSDCSGRAIMHNLMDAVKAHPNIHLCCDTTAVDLILSSTTSTLSSDDEDPTASQQEASNLVNIGTMDTNNGSKYCSGAMLLCEGGAVVQSVFADNVILATGGCGDLYSHTSNPSSARGDGVAIALRAGAQVKDMEYLQFHPTTFYNPGEKSFLLTEALRGEGAKLRDPITFELFAFQYHKNGELAPRDVVSRMIVSQMKKTNSKFVYLDITHLEESFISKRFPSIFDHLKQRGLNLASDLIPVVPAAHYSCGGIEVDVNGQTSIPHLYAIGEVACTGLHGSNRLASTSLLEGMVWGVSAVNQINSLNNDVTSNEISNTEGSFFIPCLSEDSNNLLGNNFFLGEENISLMMHGSDDEQDHTNEEKAFEHDQTDKMWLEEGWSLLRDLMWHKVGIVRNFASLKYAVDKIEVLANQAEDAFQVALETNLFLQSMNKTYCSDDNILSNKEKYCLNDYNGFHFILKNKKNILFQEAKKQKLPYQYCKFKPSSFTSLTSNGSADHCSLVKWVHLLGFRNACLTALSIAKAALKNSVSSGAHYLEPDEVVVVRNECPEAKD